MIRSMGGQMYTMLIIFIESEHKKEAWNLSGSYKKSQTSMQNSYKWMVKHLEKVTGRMVAKSMLHKSHKSLSSKTEE